jgi:mRNA-degrading endonuclease RelE of RelBE toxin-antitoxin system
MTLIKNIVQSPLFARQKKKFTKRQIKQLDEAIRTIIVNPETGTLKAGDLKGVRVYKFRIDKNQILLAYEIAESTLYLYTFGMHENFYRSLKHYRASSGKKHTTG